MAVAMAAQSNPNQNRGERGNSRDVTVDEERNENGEYRFHDNQPEVIRSISSETEEKNLLQLKRALFKHDQINEVPGELFYSQNKKK